MTITLRCRRTGARVAKLLGPGMAIALLCGGVATAAPRTAGGREEMETDRDSFTFAPTTTGAATSILEASYSFIDSSVGPDAHSFPEVLLRRGMGDRIELRRRTGDRSAQRPRIQSSGGRFVPPPAAWISSAMMTTFDDFDAWADAISGASLRLACDGVERRSWTLARVDLGSVVLQVASEGGGNLCYGANTHAGPILFVPLSHAAGHVVNGERLDDDSLLVIPRGADFLIHVRQRAHAWCSIALPEHVPVPAASTKVEGSEGAVSRLREAVHGVVSTLAGRSGWSAAHAAAARAIRDSAMECLAGRAATRAAIGRPRLDRPAIMRRAMDVIETATIVPTAAELARDVGVTNRTLLRAFKETLDVSPKHYLLLREMHAVRRSLCAGDPTADTVADVLTRHGIWEFGRFAARYRSQFGEQPSQTLHRSHA